MTARVGRRGFITLGIVGLAVVALAVVGEVVARTVTTGVIRDNLRPVIGAAADEARIDLGGLVAAQLIGGTLDSLHIAVDDVTVNDITLDADVTLLNVPARERASTADSSATGTVRLGPDAVLTLVTANSDVTSVIPDPKVEFGNGVGTLRGDVSVPIIGTIPVAISAGLGVIDGDLMLETESVDINNLTLTVADLERAPIDLRFLTDPVAICRKTTLPPGVSIAGADITGEHATIRVDASGEVFAHSDALQGSFCD